MRIDNAEQVRRIIAMAGLMVDKLCVYIALKNKKEPGEIAELYQRTLDEMVVFEKTVAELNF